MGIPVTAVIEEKYVLTAYERKIFFQEKLLERIRERIGVGNRDQFLKEKILARICSKITSVYVGCFDQIERVLGEEIWAYKVEPEIFEQFSLKEQKKYKRMARLWNDCRLAIKDLGNKMIDSVIDDLDGVTFRKKKEGEDYERYSERR